MRIHCADGQLPAQSASRLDAHGFQRHRQKAARHLFAAGYHHVIFSRIVERAGLTAKADKRSDEHTSELQSLMRNSYAVFCMKQKTNHRDTTKTTTPKRHKTQPQHTTNTET